MSKNLNQFDPDCGYVTSWMLPARALATVRGVLAIYTLTTNVIVLIDEERNDRGGEFFFSYFTNLSYVGLMFYYIASAHNTMKYVKSGQRAYGLQTSNKFLKYCYRVLTATITTYPLLTTIVFWTLIANPSTFSTPFKTWSNISRHLMNSIFALFEVFCTNADPNVWIDLVPCTIMLGAYLGLAYLTHAVAGFYPYSFLDPATQGKRVAIYIVGIAVGEAIVFLFSWGVMTLRRRIVNKFSRKKGTQQPMKDYVFEHAHAGPRRSGVSDPQEHMAFIGQSRAV